MSATQNWASFFCNWPSSINRRGVLVTGLNEAMPFKNFWVRDGMLLIERVTPDAMGARFVLLSFEVINVVKFTDPLREAEIGEAGFHAQPPRRQPKPQPQLA